MTWRSAVAGPLVLWLAGCGHPERSGRVRVALEATTACDDHCVDTFGAQVFLDDEGTSLGPGREVACGQDLVFSDLEAGTRLRVRAWASEAGRRRLEGESGAATVVAGETISVTVPLKALQGPSITGVSPDPAWPKDTLTITGSHLGTGRGSHAVALDNRPLEVVSWSNDSVVASLDPDHDGGLLVVRECGVTSPAVRVRVLVDTPGKFRLSPLGCAGLTLVGATALSGAPDMVLAFACDDPAEGYLQRYEPVECAPFGVPTRLAAGPSAIAASRDGPEVFVGLRGSPDLFRIPVPLPASPPAPFARLPAEAHVLALAATASALFALSDQPDARVWMVPLSSPGDARVIVADVSPVALAASDSRLFVAGIAPTGEAVLVLIADDAPRVDVRLSDCGQPTSVAVGSDDSRVAVACQRLDGAGRGDALILGVDLASLDISVESLGASAYFSAMAVDWAGDAVLALDAGSGLLVIASIGPTRWHRVWDLGGWSATGPVVRHPSWDHYLVAGPSGGELTVLSPYETSPPCPGGLQR